ncbi:hypothetical protein [Amycolatopsis eburnea]|uniref:Uncharacterized protein n=1 Tax=Amycolatopsis eburnea TaxID=2267691 RepID=A0A427TQ86_9PSEU|nr:hypothetical protein [Amycolatopsis eburnea]RSD26431.1 hypothetical protein EIY87_00145 [Amycolatopsis eburnea]
MTDPALLDIAGMLNELRLGPLVVDSVPGPGGQGHALQVELEGPAPAPRLARFTELLTFVDVVLGKFHDSDTTVRLTARGRAPSGVPVLVVATFDELQDVDVVTRIRTELGRAIARKNIAGLLTRLANLQTSTPA